jgi:hypothetical protein
MTSFETLPATWTLAMPAAGIALLVWLAWKPLSAVGHGAAAVAKWCIAHVVALYDYLLPIEERSGRVWVLPAALFTIVNSAPLALWLIQDKSVPLVPLGVPFYALAACATALLLNLIFVAGAYFALREGTEVMNGDHSYRNSLYRDHSAAKSLTAITLGAAISTFQLALVAEAVETVWGIRLIQVKVSSGLAYLDHLLAIANALPFLPILVRAFGYADRIVFEPGLGTAYANIVSAYGSAIFAGTVVGFWQQRRSFRLLIARTLDQENAEGLGDLLRERLKRAPAIIKKTLRRAFLDETNPDRQLRILELALLKPSYTAPLYFLRAYSRLPTDVRVRGAALVVGFLHRHHEIQRITLRQILKVAEGVETSVVNPNERAAIANVVAICRDRLLAQQAGPRASFVAT